MHMYIPSLVVWIFLSPISVDFSEVLLTKMPPQVGGPQVSVFFHDEKVLQRFTLPQSHGVNRREHHQWQTSAQWLDSQCFQFDFCYVHDFVWISEIRQLLLRAMSPELQFLGMGPWSFGNDDLRCWVTPTDIVGVTPKDWNAAWGSSHEWTSNVGCFHPGRLPARSNELDAKHGLHAGDARLGVGIMLNA